MSEKAPLTIDMERGSGLEGQKLGTVDIVKKGCGTMCCLEGFIPCLKVWCCPCWVVNDLYTKEDKYCAINRLCIQFDGCAPQCCCAIVQPASTAGFLTSELHHLNAYTKDDPCAFPCAYCCSTCLMANHNNDRSKDVVSIEPEAVSATGVAPPQQQRAAETKPFKW